MTERSDSEEFKVSPGVPERVFVEIGFGNDPVFLGAGRNEVRRSYFTNTHYIGVDVDAEQSRLAKSTISGPGADATNPTDHMLSIGFNEGRIGDLALPDGSVDEIYVANVFAETCLHQDYTSIDHKYMQLMSKYASSTDVGEKLKLLRSIYPVLDGDPTKPLSSLLVDLLKARALLAENGQLTIVENNTPMNPNMLMQLLATLGYDLKRMIWEGHTEWQAMCDRYFIQDGEILDVMPYILVARPATN